MERDADRPARLFGEGHRRGAGQGRLPGQEQAPGDLQGRELQGDEVSGPCALIPRRSSKAALEGLSGHGSRLAPLAPRHEAALVWLCCTCLRPHRGVSQTPSATRSRLAAQARRSVHVYGHLPVSPLARGSPPRAASTRFDDLSAADGRRSSRPASRLRSLPSLGGACCLLRASREAETVETNDQQTSRLADYGWSQFFQSQLSVADLARSIPVRVFAVHRNGLDVAGPDFDGRVPPIVAR